MTAPVVADCDGAVDVNSVIPLKDASDETLSCFWIVTLFPIFVLPPIFTFPPIPMPPVMTAAPVVVVLDSVDCPTDIFPLNDPSDKVEIWPCTLRLS